MNITFDKATSFQVCPTCQASVPILNGIVRDSDKACGMYIFCPHGHEPGQKRAVMILALGDSSVKPFEPVSIPLGLLVENGKVVYRYTKSDAKLPSLSKLPGKMLNFAQLQNTEHYAAFLEVMEAFLADVREVREYFNIGGRLGSWL